jgi:hypothetical protein
MKFKIYTGSNAGEDREGCDHRYTSQEYSTLSLRQYCESFSSKEAIIREFLSKDSRKLIALDYLIQHIRKRNYRSVISLGSGACVIEYLLSCGLPENTRIVATDFNDFYISKSKLFFPEIISEKFDFYRDNIEQLSKKTGIQFEFAYFLGSAYVLDDNEYVGILNQLQDSGIEGIIDFSPALVPYSQVPVTILGEIKNSITKTFRGKFHGYSRTQNDMRYIYKQTGFTIEKELQLGPYTYVSVLKNPRTLPK